MEIERPVPKDPVEGRMFILARMALAFFSEQGAICLYSTEILHLKKLTAPLVVAFTLFGLAFADIMRWILIATRIENFEEAKQEFISFYPLWLKNPRVSALLLIIMLVVAAIIFRHERKKQGNSLLFKIFFIASIVLASWLLFTLM